MFGERELAMVVTFSCDLAGGILVADPVVLGRWDREVLGEFNVALDPEGKSDVIYDYPRGNWAATWRSQTQGVVERCKRGEMAFLVLHEGLFYIDLDIGSGKEIRGGEGTVEFRSRIVVDSGAVAVAEADKLMENWRDPPEEEYYRVFRVANGEYLVRFVVVNSPETVRAGEWVFGTPERPAIQVQVVPGRGDVPRMDELFRYAFRPGGV